MLLKSEEEEDQGEKIEDKLYQEAFTKLQNLEKKKQHKAEEEIRKLTFKPEISKNSRNLEFQENSKKDQKIEERYKEINSFKEEMIMRLREKYKMDKDMTFKPKISEISDRVASLKYSGKGVVERLKEHGENIEKKKAVLADVLQQKLAEECSFHPNVNYEGNDQVRFNIFFIIFLNIFNSHFTLKLKIKVENFAINTLKNTI